VKRRLFIIASVIAIAVGMLSSAERAQADSFGMPNSSGCVHSMTLYSGPMAGLSRLMISFHITIPANTPTETVQGRWTSDSGGSGAAQWWTGRVAGAGDWDAYVGYRVNGATWSFVNIVPGGTGTASFKITEPYNYGGCFYVDHIIVDRWFLSDGGGGAGGTGGGGGGGIATPTPRPSGAATPSPYASIGAGCDPSAAPVPSCPPPAGYCWGYGPPAPSQGWPIYPCDTPGPTASPSGSAPPSCVHLADGACFFPGTYAKARSTALNGCAASGSAGGIIVGTSATLVNGRTYQYNIQWTGVTVKIPTTPSGSCTMIDGLGNSGFASRATDGGTSLWGGFTGQSINNANASGTITGTFTCNSTCGSTNGTLRWDGFDGRDEYTLTIIYGEIWPVGSAPATASPSPSPSSGPTQAPPRGYGSPNATGNPDQQSGGGGGGDGTTDICPPNPGILACATNFIPSFVPGSIASGAVDALIEDLKGRAPFGYAYQIGDAINSAATGGAGAGSDYCFDLPRWTPDGEVSTEACIPLQDMADAASYVRSGLLALLTILVAVSLFKTATGGLGGGGGGDGG